MQSTAQQAEAIAFETDVPPRLDRLPWSRWHLRMATALGVTFLLDGLEGGVGGSLSGALQSVTTLHLTDAQLGIASSGYLGGTVLGALLFGYLADVYGRKSLFFWTLAVYVCATAATALSWNLATFTLCRVLTGAGIGGEYTAITSAIDELIPARVRGTANLVIGSTFWVGVILGSLVAVGFLSDSMFGLRLGWRFAMLSGVPIAIVVLFMRRFIPESPRWLLTHGRVEEATAIVEGIEQSVHAQFGSLAPVPHAITLQRDVRSTLSKVGLLLNRKNRPRALLCLGLTMAQSFFYNSVFFSSTLVLLRFYGVSAAHAGVLFLPIAFTNFVGPVLLSRLFDSVGRRVMISLNFCLTGVVFAVSSVLFVQGHLSTVAQVAFWAASFFFAASAAGSAYLTTSELFPQPIRASAIAIFYAAGTLLGGVLGPAVFGMLLNRGERAPIFYGFMASALIMLLAGVAQAIWGVAAERKPLEEIA
ncbi:MFS transporter [Acidipila sp. EB88]|uniref:MFS transporter n=1 Tax=Acidipila sp. EB88 TaxID=2305226 RepID=UPI000F5EE630|nr:MFS transporter [Acidipila sp. EB88]RRA49534.1 MFS transporter [Acidipila sp. EB88]